MTLLWGRSFLPNGTGVRSCFGAGPRSCAETFCAILGDLDNRFGRDVPTTTATMTTRPAQQIRATATRTRRAVCTRPPGHELRRRVDGKRASVAISAASINARIVIVELLLQPSSREKRA